MTTPNADSISRYAALRGELERLRLEFAREGARHNALLAQRYWDAEPLADAGWESFASRAASPGGWEEWHVLAGGEGLIRFNGDGSALDAFTRLAESGWLVLAGLEQAPAPGEVTLGNDAYLCGWVAAVFETALAAMTPTLRLEYERWGLLDGEGEALTEFDPGYWYGGGADRHPAHPFVQSLTRDLFSTSAEAIACWLDPDHVLTVDVRLDDLPIRLPTVVGPSPSVSLVPAKSALAATDELSTREAAGYLNVSVDTLNAHVRAGRLPRRNVSPHGSSRGPFLYKVADLAKLRDGSYRRTVPSDQPKRVKARKVAPPPEPDYDGLDL